MFFGTLQNDAKQESSIVGYYEVRGKVVNYIIFESIGNFIHFILGEQL